MSTTVFCLFVFVFLPRQEENKSGLLQRSGQQIFIKICCVSDSGNEQKDLLPPRVTLPLTPLSD